MSLVRISSLVVVLTIVIQINSTAAGRFDKKDLVDTILMEKLENLTAAVQRMSEANRRMEDRVKKIAGIANLLEWKMEKENVGNLFSWKLIGQGTYGSYDDRFDRRYKTFDKCLELCENKRKTDGPEWNGMMLRRNNQYGECSCFKNGRGHKADKGYYHYRVVC